MNQVMKNNKQLHPPEISHVRSKRHARALLGGAGFDLAGYSFGLNDFFVQAVIVGRKSVTAPAPTSKA
jgi:hypothetical protein